MLNINKLRVLKAQWGLQFSTPINGTIQLPNAQQSWQQTQQLFQNPYLQPQPIAMEESYPIAGMTNLQEQYFNDLKEKQDKISTFTNPYSAADFTIKTGKLPTKFGNFTNNAINSVGNFLTNNVDLMNTGLDMINQNLFENISNSSNYNNVQTGIGIVSNIIGKENPVLGLGIKAGSALLNGINSLGAKRARIFSVDQGVKNNMGGSYQGSYNFIDNAASHSGEKVGLFSRNKRRRYNRDMDRAQELQDALTQIHKNTEDFKNMSNLDPISYNQDINGGIDFRYAAIRKHGGRIKNLKNIDYTPNQEIEPIIDITSYKPNQDFEPTISLFQEGGKTKSQSEITFQSWFNSIPPEYRDPRYDYQMAFNILDKELLKNHAKDPNQFHLPSVSGREDKDGRIPFLKLGRRDENKEVDMEFTEFYENDKGKNFRNKYDVIYDNDRYYYVPKKFEEGGNLSKKDSKSESKETSQKNIIPEGALHAHKHHMENDENITKKGIPVIDNNGEQQAEIEREEWTMTLELTKTIEELYKEYYSEDTKQSRKDELAIEAGKILVYEILHNTEDRANLIKRCKEGGTLNES